MYNTILNIAIIINFLAAVSLLYPSIQMIIWYKNSKDFKNRERLLFSIYLIVSTLFTAYVLIKALQNIPNSNDMELFLYFYLIITVYCSSKFAGDNNKSTITYVLLALSIILMIQFIFSDLINFKLLKELEFIDGINKVYVVKMTAGMLIVFSFTARALYYYSKLEHKEPEWYFPILFGILFFSGSNMITYYFIYLYPIISLMILSLSSIVANIFFAKAYKWEK